jgi:hypothetical protein
MGNNLTVRGIALSIFEYTDILSTIRYNMYNLYKDEDAAKEDTDLLKRIDLANNHHEKIMRNPPTSSHPKIVSVIKLQKTYFKFVRNYAKILADINELGSFHYFENLDDDKLMDVLVIYHILYSICCHYKSDQDVDFWTRFFREADQYNRDAVFETAEETEVLKFRRAAAKKEYEQKKKEKEEEERKKQEEEEKAEEEEFAREREERKRKNRMKYEKMKEEKLKKEEEEKLKEEKLKEDKIKEENTVKNDPVKDNSVKL